MTWHYSRERRSLSGPTSSSASRASTSLTACVLGFRTQRIQLRRAVNSVKSQRWQTVPDSFRWGCGLVSDIALLEGCGCLYSLGSTLGSASEVADEAAWVGRTGLSSYPRCGCTQLGGGNFAAASPKIVLWETLWDRMAVRYCTHLRLRSLPWHQPSGLGKICRPRARHRRASAEVRRGEVQWSGAGRTPECPLVWEPA